MTELNPSSADKGAQKLALIRQIAAPSISRLGESGRAPYEFVSVVTLMANAVRHEKRRRVSRRETSAVLDAVLLLLFLSVIKIVATRPVAIDRMTNESSALKLSAHRSLVHSTYKLSRLACTFLAPLDFLLAHLAGCHQSINAGLG